MPRHYCYAFIREDLSWPQRVVQTAHASIEATQAFALGSLPDHPYLVVLSAKTKDRLHRICQYLTEKGIRFVGFYESDRNDELTSIVTEPIPEESPLRSHLRKFQLLKEKEMNLCAC